MCLLSLLLLTFRNLIHDWGTVHRYWICKSTWSPLNLAYQWANSKCFKKFILECSYGGFLPSGLVESFIFCISWIIKYEFLLKFYSPVLPLLFTSILRNQHIFFLIQQVKWHFGMAPFVICRVNLPLYFSFTSTSLVYGHASVDVFTRASRLPFPPVMPTHEAHRGDVPVHSVLQVIQSSTHLSAERRRYFAVPLIHKR